MSKKERKLSAAEQRRKEKFLEKCSLMEAEGYRMENLSFSVLQINLLSVFIALPVNFLFMFSYFLFNDFSLSSVYLPYAPLLFLLIFLLLIVVHEAIHGITWGYFASDGRKSIEYGVIWQALTPYCTCSSPLTKKQYVWGALMPTIVLGFLPGVIAIITGWEPLFLLSQFMILAGAGDFLIVARLLLHRPKNAQVIYLDHPYECGLVAFLKNID